MSSNCHGLRCRVSSPTHDPGGILEVVATRADLDTPDVDVLDVGISDHRLLSWSCQLERPPPVYHTSTYSPWCRINVDEFNASLRQSTLCTDLSDDADDASDDNAVADSLAEQSHVHCRQSSSDQGNVLSPSCASDVWFEEKCLTACKECRRLERQSKRSPNHLQQLR